MTYRAILDDGKEHKPLLLLVTGQMTAPQIDKEYKGVIGRCPDCEAFLASTDLSAGGSLAAAILNRDRRVSYRRGCYCGTELTVQMHFKHQSGYLVGGIAPCGNINNASHRAVVDAIATQYQKDLGPGYTIDSECQFVKAGTPPETYRPDVYVKKPDGTNYLCIEYQRSPEKFENAVRRHGIRQSEWTQVIWFFDQKIYELNSTKEFRDWLFDNNQLFYKCWADKDTRIMQVEEGTFAHEVITPSQITKRRQYLPQACSIADLMNEYELSQNEELSSNRRINRPAQTTVRSEKGFNLLPQAQKQREKERALFNQLKRQKEERLEKERFEREIETKILVLQDISVAKNQLNLFFNPILNNWPEALRLRSLARSKASVDWTLDELVDEFARLNALSVHVEPARKRIEKNEADARKKACAELLKQQALQRKLKAQLAAQQAATEAAVEKIKSHKKRLADMDAYWEESLRRLKEALQFAIDMRNYQLQQAKAKRAYEEHLKAERRAAEFSKWGVAIGKVGAMVRWKRGTPFVGLIKRWCMDRPVISRDGSSMERWAYSSDDYDILDTCGLPQA